MFVGKPSRTIFYPSNIGLLDLQVQAYVFKGLGSQQLWAIIDLKETVKEKTNEIIKLGNWIWFDLEF